MKSSRQIANRLVDDHTHHVPDGEILAGSIAAAIKRERVSRRDKFAMAALAGILAGADGWAKADEIAKTAFCVADAMEARRNA